MAPPSKKKITAKIKLQVPAGSANPAPPIGPALGQHGVNIMGFCKEFNAQTMKQKGDILPVVITVYADKSFTFITRNPPMSRLILKELAIEKGSSTPHSVKVGTISKAGVNKVAKQKLPDLIVNTIEAAEKVVEGTCRSMGVLVEGLEK